MGSLSCTGALVGSEDWTVLSEDQPVLREGFGGFPSRIKRAVSDQVTVGFRPAVTSLVSLPDIFVSPAAPGMRNAVA